MYSDINIKMIILLFILSIAAFVSHRIGLMDTRFPVLIKTSDSVRKLITSKSTKAHLEKNKNIILQCQLITPHQYNFCGVGVVLGSGNIQYGVDLGEFTRLALTIKYKSPNNTDKLKITFRNYNDNYSNIEDSVSLKFNSITYNPNFNKPAVIIPFGALKVDNWWIEQYKIGFNNSHVDLSNIALIEILTDSMNTVGDYRIEIKSIVLYGQLISEPNLLKLILLIWLVSIIFLITLQRNKLKNMSITDVLTGLYNRQGIGNWTNKKILSRIKLHSMYMFYFDLDDFKKVNDSYGHKVGDQLLIAFCHKVQNYLDSTLNIDFAFARLSADEFTLVIYAIKDNQIHKFAENLLSLLDAPIILEANYINVRASLGIAELTQDVKTFDDLLARADSAMYYAKKEGKNRYKIFNESVSKDIFFRKQTAEKLVDVIVEDNFQLNFMPIIDAKSLEIVSVEVLLRTNASSLEGIGPDSFIPIAEEFNLIKHIDLWVIEATFKKIVKERELLNHTPLIFCINISAVELHNPVFVVQLKALLDLYSIPPELIELELTETSLVETDLMSISTLKAIHSLGVKLTLDDFGTGYTAFSQLINYPVACLKIDKSFIDGLHSRDDTKATMIKAIISIAKSYQLKTIGEGIEHREQYEFLAEHGCDMIQGYLFAKAMTWSDLKELINDPKSQQSRRLMLKPNV